MTAAIDGGRAADAAGPSVRRLTHSRRRWTACLRRAGAPAPSDRSLGFDFPLRLRLEIDGARVSISAKASKSRVPAMRRHHGELLRFSRYRVLRIYPHALRRPCAIVMPVLAAAARTFARDRPQSAGR